MARITLATLTSATAQQVFDQVRDHMLRQGQRSMLTPSGRTCAYRSHDGLSCAAGCLIADDEYTAQMEGWPWRAMVERRDVPGAHMQLIRSLQGIHDGYMPERWERELRLLARDEGLRWTITLATLSTASAQEVFEQVAKHLLKQNAVALGDAGCPYRTHTGLPEGHFKDLDDRRAQGIWPRARVAAGIKHRGCVIHSLRHTCASRLLESGFDLKIVKEWLGHSSIATTDIYTHLQTKQLSSAAQSVHRLRQAANAA